MRQKRWTLFPSILFWVFLSLLAYTFLGWVWGTGAFFSWERALTSWRIGAETNPLDRVKVTLTAVGGVGAVGYLVIKYRERASLERGEADERLLRAVQQLGDDSPQVRIAGVYALADVADTFEGPYHQRVVDILCGYLRTDRLLKDPDGEARYALKEDGSPDDDKPLSNDGAVESTILSVLSSHLKTASRKPGADSPTFSPGPWSHCTIDLHGTIFTEKVNLHRLFLGNLDLSNTTFTQHANFSNTIFNNANFQGATFNYYTKFNNTIFTQPTYFLDTTFNEYVNFNDTTFTQPAYFLDTTFNDYADFEGAWFMQDAHFSDTIFVQDANFSDTIFAQEAHFQRTKFTYKVTFQNVTFKQNAHFRCITFARDANFNGASFTHNANFGQVKFRQNACFSHTTFAYRANFWEATFAQDTNFSRATFEGVSNFEHSVFNITKGGDLIALKFPESLDIEDGIPVGANWGEFNEKGELVLVWLTGKVSEDDSLVDNGPDDQKSNHRSHHRQQ